MTVDDLLDIIKDDILDSSFSDELIERFINQAIKTTSSRVLLPVLEASGTVDTVVGTPYVDLPDGFGHNLFHAATAKGTVKVFSSMRFMLDEYPLFGTGNEIGDVKHCCLAGSRIAIHPIPPAITQMTLFFHGWPARLTGRQDVGQYIDGEDHQENIIVNFAMWRLHKKIEDGLEGPMRNTEYHLDQFEAAIKRFGLSIKQGQSRPSPTGKSGCF